jgi:hypothetical protein
MSVVASRHRYSNAPRQVGKRTLGTGSSWSSSTTRKFSTNPRNGKVGRGSRPLCPDPGGRPPPGDRSAVRCRCQRAARASCAEISDVVPGRMRVPGRPRSTAGGRHVHGCGPAEGVDPTVGGGVTPRMGKVVRHAQRDHGEQCAHPGRAGRISISSDCSSRSKKWRSSRPTPATAQCTQSPAVTTAASGRDPATGLYHVQPQGSRVAPVSGLSAVFWGMTTRATGLAHPRGFGC